MTRWICVGFLICLAACTTRRTITISPTPPDAILSVDGIPRGVGTLTEQFKFKGSDDTHRITVSRPGYKEDTIILSKDDPSTNYEVVLKPLTRRLSFTITPVPAFLDIDGTPVSSDPVTEISREMEFTKDEHDNWTSYTITASRPGFQPCEINVTWTDPSPDYTLDLQPMRKDLNITSTPPGATVTFDGALLGTTPLTDKAQAFLYDVDANQYVVHKLALTKPGYDEADQSIAWDDGKTDYAIALPSKQKTVHIDTDPAGAIVIINGKVLPPGDNGVPTALLDYTPINDKGDLPVFTANVSKKTEETEWYPVDLSIPWDDGRTDYSVTLKEVKTRNVPMLSISLARDSDGEWQVSPQVTQTLGEKDITEGPDRQAPALIYAAPAGTTIGSLSVSPDGTTILFDQLSGTDSASFRSQIMAVSTTSAAGVQQVTDGKALDVYPSYTPDGNSIVFSSNRAGKRLNICRKSVTGGEGIEQLTNVEEQDLWPSVDASPHPRLFYQAMSDSQSDAQLYTAPVDGGPRLDLATISVSEPRISPKADSVIFTSVNQRTGNREIYKIPDQGGPPEDLTNDPDSDCYDPSWSKDGSQIAYVSDRGMDEDRRRNPDIWIIDLSHPDKPTQVTTNGSIDDNPVWDPSGNAIYFRSNRGGQWGIWKISIH
ncbi:MAG: PEGA domain-containing protein [Tepidisphaeraceae bacterium]